MTGLCAQSTPRCAVQDAEAATDEEGEGDKGCGGESPGAGGASGVATGEVPGASSGGEDRKASAGGKKRGKGGKKCRHGGDGLTQEERGVGVRVKKPEDAVAAAGAAGGRRGGGERQRGKGAGKGGGKGKVNDGGAVAEEQRMDRKAGGAGRLGVAVAKVSKAVRSGKAGKKVAGKGKGRGK